MLLTVEEKGCRLYRVTSKRGDTESTRLGPGAYPMIIIPNPRDKHGKDWAVLVSDPAVGAEATQFEADIEGARLDAVLYAVLPAGGWDGLLYKEAVGGETKRAKVPRGRHSFARRINPSGKITDPPWLVTLNGIGMAEPSFATNGSLLRVAPLFPPYFNSIAEDGTRASGPPAVTLQLIMQAASRILPEFIRQALPPLALTGVMDDAAIAWLKTFQTFFGLESDGNFGPDTRRTFYKELDVDIVPLMNDLFLGQTTWVDVDGTAKPW